MNNSISQTTPLRGCSTPKTYKTLGEAMRLVEEAVTSEWHDELYYDYLISLAPTIEEKNIITSIRNDERKHNRMFRRIYKDITGREIMSSPFIEFQKPNSYLVGIKKAFFGELAAMERYRIIRAGMPNQYYRDMVFEILTDELKHADKYTYILIYNTSVMDSTDENKASAISTKTFFTTGEALQLAKKLDIDFSKSEFDLEEFRVGLNVELEHIKKYYLENADRGNLLTTAKIVLGLLTEYPDYYKKLKTLKEDSKGYWKAQKGREPKTFTLTELAKFNGSNDKPAYVAVNGIVYDVSLEKTWGGGSHFGLQAGKDLTEQFNSCHGSTEILSNLPQVGTLKQ